MFAEQTLQETILATKLHIPVIKNNHIYRPNLVDKIQAGMEGQLTLISAPPGYGKSTLLSEFANQYSSALIWYRLDDKDNHPSIFFRYLMAALNHAETNLNLEQYNPDIAQLAPKDKFLYIITEISKLEFPIVLILEDFHLINNTVFLEDFVYFVQNLPPQLRLIISTRSDPPFPLSNMRVSGLLTEIRTVDLAFNEIETIQFFLHTNQIEINDTEALQLVQLTDGWPASLQMASISLQKRGNFPELLQSLQGNNRFILDYLLEEVLNHQSETVQNFLYATAILEKMNAAVCDQLMVCYQPEAKGLVSSQIILEQLEQNNLFLIPLDDQRNWYRYHHLFADLLRIRLEKRDKTLVKNLHDHAALWFEEQDMLREAVHHAQCSDNPKRIETSLAKNAIAMIYNGQLTKLAEWINTVPPLVLQDNPWLLVAKAWLLSATGEIQTVESILKQAESLLTKERVVENKENLILQISILRFYLSVIQNDLATIQQHLLTCQSLLKESNFVLHGFVLNLFATSLRLNGHIHTAEQIAHKALYISRRSGDLNMILDSYLHLAHVYLDRGKLHYAAETCIQAIQFAQEKTSETSPSWLVSLGNIYAIYSQVLWEWNQLPLGLSFAQKAVKLSQQWGQPNSLAFTYYTLAKLLQASGSSIEATQAIQSAYQVAEKISPQYSARKSRQIAMFHFAQNDFLSAEFWVNSLPPSIFTDLSASHLRDYVAITKIWLSLNQNQKAINFLKQWLPLAVESNLEVRILEAKILLAIAHWQMGEKKESLQVFEEALKKAKPEGFIRTFVILGKPTVQILAQHFVNSENYGDYILLILNALDPKLISKNGAPPPITTQPTFKLSDREVQVLRFLQTNLTLPEIASELQISTHTIRSHTKNIYAKLEVNRRSFAVNRAKSLHII